MEVSVEVAFGPHGVADGEQQRHGQQGRQQESQQADACGRRGRGVGRKGVVGGVFGQHGVGHREGRIGDPHGGHPGRCGVEREGQHGRRERPEKEVAPCREELSAEQARGECERPERGAQYFPDFLHFG